MTTPNWQHNSGKKKTTKGISKNRIKSRKQTLKHLKNKFKINV